MKNFIFKMRLDKLKKLILIISGEGSFDNNEKKVIPIKLSDFYKNKKTIDKLSENFFNKKDNKLFSYLFVYYQAKQLFLFGENNKALLFIKKINNILNQEKSSHDWLNIRKKLLEAQINNNIWIKSIENNFAQLNKKINKCQEIIEECHALYYKYEVNSKEHLEISSNHLEAALDLANLKVRKQDKKILSNLQKQEGEILISELLLFKKIVNEKKEISNLIKSEILLEVIKLKFYLEMPEKEIFQEVHNYCKLNVEFNNNDPIGYATGLFLPPEILLETKFSTEGSFINFLYSFYIEIKKNKEKKVYLNIKQFSNFVAKNVDERLKIYEGSVEYK